MDDHLLKGLKHSLCSVAFLRVSKFFFSSAKADFIVNNIMSRSSFLPQEVSAGIALTCAGLGCILVPAFIVLLAVDHAHISYKHLQLWRR
jgi:hypothetical protein